MSVFNRRQRRRLARPHSFRASASGRYMTDGRRRPVASHRLGGVSTEVDELEGDERPGVEGDGPADDDGGPAGLPVRAGEGPRRPTPGAVSVLPPRPLREDPAGPEDVVPRRPLVAEWVRDPVPMLRWWLGEQAHALGFHLLRIPLYVGRAAQWTPRGLSRGLVGLWRWVTDAQSAGLRWQAAELGDVEGYLYLSQQATARVRARAVTALLVSGAVAAGVLVAWSTPPGRLAVLGIVIAAGGWLGRPADRPLFEHPVLPPSRVKVTPDLLVEAFCAAKLCNKHDDAERHQTVAFLAPVARDGHGWRAVVDLPGGHTASKALNKREDLAAGLGIDEVRVFLERVRGDDGSARRVAIWVADRDPYAAKPQVSPLASAPKWDFWEPVPFGTDAQGRLVALAMVFTSLLVGAIPRMGKTYAARIVAAAAALDPAVRLIPFDGKGGADWRPFAQVAYRCGFGAREHVVAHLADVVAECCADMERRYDTLGELPYDACPESKVTPAITANRRLDMPLTLMCIDEVQEYLGHPTYGADILDGLVRLAKVGPAVGYMLDLATQKPDSDTIPTALRDVIGSRFALKTMNWQSSDTILGSGAKASGLDASKFQRSHKGVGILLGADDGALADEGPQIVRTHLLDREALEAVCARGRALRMHAGTLEGHAAGEQTLDDRPRRSILDDVAAMFAVGENKLWSETICARLAEDHPEDYTGWGPNELAGALTPYGVETDQLWGRDATGRGRNRRGVLRQDVLNAIAGRPKTTTGDRNSEGRRTGTPLAGPGSLAPDTASSSTPASGPDQAPSDLAHPAGGADLPANQDSGPRPLAANDIDPDPTDDHQP